MRVNGKTLLCQPLLTSATLFILSLFFAFQPVYAQPARSCGDIPLEPEPQIRDGASSLVAELVANSVQVNDFIDRADLYLDCEAELGKMAVNLPEQVQIQRATSLMALTKRRNAIGDEFNAQLAAYRKANPD